MVRTHGRALYGQRLIESVPHGHWYTTTVFMGLRSTGIVSPVVVDGPINGRVFLAWVQQHLCHELRPKDIVGRTANRGHTHDGAHGNRGHASSDFCRVAMHYFRWRWTLESDESLQNIDDGRLRAHFANAASNYERTGSALDLMESRLAAARRLHRRFDGYVVRSSRARLRIL
jgi:hypothetical protein